MTDGQRTALANLARKKAGYDVDWISIADARALTDIGLAERHASGWRITEKGEAALAVQAPDRPGAEIIPSTIVHRDA